MSKSKSPKSKSSKSENKKSAIASTSWTFKPGWIVVDVSSATGGVSYDRTVVDEVAINNNDGVRVDTMTRKTVDHVGHVTAIDALVKKVDYVLRKHATRLGGAARVGWFVDDATLDLVRTEVAELRAEAERLNALGRQLGSERQATIDIVPLRLDLDREEAVREITRTIRDVLGAFNTALRAGDVESLHKLKLRAINLDKLAVGFQADAIRMALDCAVEAGKTLKTAATVAGRAARNAGSDAAAIKAAESAAAVAEAAKLDLGAIEAALLVYEG